jgi:pimeloyl-ACP methyl ester carboxylesterase
MIKATVWAAVICTLFNVTSSTFSASAAGRAEKQFPAIGNFVQLDGGSVHYIQAGQPMGTAPVIILLHGAGGNLRDWTFALIPKLQDRYTVFAFDRPGHGYTDVFDRKGATLTHQAQVLQAAASKLGIKKATLLGYSFGGAVSLQWVLDQPQMFDGLTLVSAVSNPWTGPVATMYHLAGKPVINYPFNWIVAGLVPPNFVRKAYGSVFSPQMPPNGFIDHVGVPLTVRPKSFRANARQVLRLLPAVKTMSQRYGELSLPIEMIHGDADETLPVSVHADVMKAKVPAINYTRLKGMGHGTYILSTDLLVAALDRLHAR